MKEKVKTKLFEWYSDGIDLHFISELLVWVALDKQSTILLPHHLMCKPMPSLFASSHSTSNLRGGVKVEDRALLERGMVRAIKKYFTK
jgi:hypothetical protein